MFFPIIRNFSHKRRIGAAALIRGRRLLTFLCQMRRLIEGGAYSSKYDNLFVLIKVNSSPDQRSLGEHHVTRFLSHFLPTRGNRHSY